MDSIDSIDLDLDLDLDLELELELEVELELELDLTWIRIWIALPANYRLCSSFHDTMVTSRYY